MDASPNNRRISRALYASGTAHMIVGTLVAAIGAYLFQLVAGRHLGPTAFAPITVLWTIQFLVFTTVFVPMEQLTIRRLSAAEQTSGPWRLFGGVIAGSVVVSTVFAAATRHRLLADEWVYLPILAILIAAYGGFALGRGILAGRRRFREYGFSTLAESVLRLLLAIAILGIGMGAVGVAWSMVAGPFVVLLWRPLSTETDLDDRPISPGSAQALATSIRRPSGNWITIASPWPTSRKTTLSLSSPGLSHGHADSAAAATRSPTAARCAQGLAPA